MEDVFDYLEKLAEEIKGGKKSKFSGNKVIDQTKCIEYLNAIGNVLPMALRESQYILHDRDNIISEARAKAENIVRQAHFEADKIVNQNNILAQAKQQADELMDSAEKYAVRVDKECKRRVDGLFAESEANLSEILRLIRSSREEMLRTVIKKNPYEES